MNNTCFVITLIRKNKQNLMNIKISYICVCFQNVKISHFLNKLPFPVFIKTEICCHKMLKF